MSSIVTATYSQKGIGFAGLFVLFVVIVIIILASQLDSKYVLIGLLPVLFIVGAFLLLGASMVTLKVPDGLIEELIINTGIIVAVVVVVLLFISHMCARIRPIELFEDKSEDTKLKEAEAEVCKLVTEAYNYIQADIGMAGIDRPELVTEAKQKAMTAASVAGPILGCPVPTDNEGLQPEERLDRMDRTLDRFVEPELKKGCIKAAICIADEGFEDPPPQTLDVDQRIKAILTKAETIKVQYLDPMKQKQADLQSGKASDSDKQRGAAAVLSPS